MVCWLVVVAPVKSCSTSLVSLLLHTQLKTRLIGPNSSEVTRRHSVPTGWTFNNPPQHWPSIHQFNWSRLLPCRLSTNRETKNEREKIKRLCLRCPNRSILFVSKKKYSSFSLMISRACGPRPISLFFLTCKFLTTHVPRHPRPITVNN